MGIPAGDDGEVAAVAADLEDALVEREVERLALGDAAVVLDRLLARRLVALHRKRIAADLDQLRRREELHVRGIADDGVDERALLDDAGVEPLALRFDGTGQPDGAGADEMTSCIAIYCRVFVVSTEARMSAEEEFFDVSSVDSRAVS